MTVKFEHWHVRRERGRCSLFGETVPAIFTKKEERGAIREPEEQKTILGIYTIDYLLNLLPLPSLTPSLLELTFTVNNIGIFLWIKC